MKQYSFFNIVCTILIVFFVGATFWLFRFEISNVIFADSDANQYKAKVKSVEKNKDEKQEVSSTEKNEKKEEQKNEENSKQEEDTKKSENQDEKKDSDEDKSSEKDKLPKEYNLAIPFTSQAPEADWSQPWQDACEEATVLMLDAYYKDYNISTLFAKDEIKKMVNWEQEQDWGRSIEVEKIAKLIKWYAGIEAKVVNNPDIGQIKKQLADGTPVFVVAHGKTLDNPYFTDGGPDYHTLVIRGYTDSHFITNDPGTSRGKNFKYTYENLMDAIHDYNDGDVKQGEKKVLVLE